MAAKKKPDKSAEVLASGVRVVSVDGPFNSRVLVDMPSAAAEQLLDGALLSAAAPSVVREAVERDLQAIAERDEALANSTLAATARTMAVKLENPYTSATAASMCARALVEVMEKLRELLPPEERKGTLHGIRSGRALRLVDGKSEA